VVVHGELIQAVLGVAAVPEAAKMGESGGHIAMPISATDALDDEERLLGVAVGEQRSHRRTVGEILGGDPSEPIDQTVQLVGDAVNNAHGRSRNVNLMSRHPTSGVAACSCWRTCRRSTADGTTGFQEEGRSKALPESSHVHLGRGVGRDDIWMVGHAEAVRRTGPHLLLIDHGRPSQRARLRCAHNVPRKLS
jgi:hypothetical protein